MIAHQLKAAVVTALVLIAFAAAACSRVGAAQADQKWTTYTDPGAHAFTVEVPAGWQVAGGTQRISASDIREGVVMRSPDGAVQLFFGDPALPVFMVPSPALASMGLRTGMSFSPGPGMNLFLAAYVPGQRFAAQWGAFRISEICGQVALEGSRRLPQVADAADQMFRQLGVPGTMEAGDAAFGCVLANGAPAKGYAFTATRLTPTRSSELWNVASAAGYIAPADRLDEARALLAHVIESYRVDPVWAAQQQVMPANVGAVVIQTNAAIAQTILGALPETFVAAAQAPASTANMPAAPVEAPTPAPTEQASIPDQPPQDPYGGAAPNPYAPGPSMAGLQDAPPMDMSWAIQSQMINQANGDAAVRNAFNSAYAMLSQARANGHPVEGQLVLGNNPNTFGDGGYADRSNRTTRAIEDNTLRATQGCDRVMENSRGDRWYSC